MQLNITNSVSGGYTPYPPCLLFFTVSDTGDGLRCVPGNLVELEPEERISIPGRWAVGNPADYRAELKRLAVVFAAGTQALGGLYMRICDTIRKSNLTDSEVRSVLESNLSAARVSELLRVAHAPEEVYIRYTTGFFGFKAALRECRGYVVTPSEELRRRKMRRTAERLIILAGGATQITIKTWTIIIQ